MRVKGRRSRRDAVGALDACRAVPSMIASGAMRNPNGQAGRLQATGVTGQVAGLSGEWRTGQGVER